MKKKKLSLDQSTWTLSLRILREHVRPHMSRILLAMFFMALAAGATGALAKLMEPILDKIFITKDLVMLRLISLAVIVVFAVKGISSYLQYIMMDYVGLSIVSSLQMRVFKHLMHADLAFFHETPTGQLLSHFNNDIASLRQSITKAFSGIGKDFLTLVMLLGLMFYQDAKLALIAFFVFPMGCWPIIRMGRRMRKYSGGVQTQIAGMTAHLSQVFHGIRHVKAYNQESFEVKRTSVYVDKIQHLSYKTTKVRAASQPIMEMLGGIAIVSIISYGGYQVIIGTRTTGAFFSFITALLFAYEPMKRLANLNLSLQEGLAAAARIYAYLDKRALVVEKKKPQELIVKKGQVSFQKVSFSYQEATVLHDMDIEIKAGQTTALVGSSGAGKSTILNLIPRFYDVDSGSVTVDGVDVRDLSFKSLREHISLVSQDIFLFDDTVRANILYGAPKASEKMMIKAAEAAAAHEFIMQLPNGYDTMIGENGVTLSGGQRQRLAIARAMIKNAPILLLDEATSSLDNQSERQVQQALNELMKNRTTLVIAHRLSTIQDADMIYVIDKGQVVEKGTHHQLLKLKGTYAHLHSLQLGH